MKTYPAGSSIALAVSLLLLAACGAGGGGGGGGGGGSNGTTIPAVVTIQNVRNNGIVHSGFLVASVSNGAGVTAVDVALDGGAYQPAPANGGTWLFQLPTGTDTWRDGSAHAIAARAKDAAGNTGVAGTISVRKGVNRDVNGDGYEDLAVAAYSRGSSTGRLYVFHSTGPGGVTATAAGSASSLLDGDAIDNDFGRSVALGDVNGDGLADVIAGAPRANSGANSGAGRVYVFHSRGNTGVTVDDTAIVAGDDADSILEGDAANDRFGISVAAGDVTGDGIGDVVAGAVEAAGNAGKVYVFRSRGNTGVTANPEPILAGSEAESILQGDDGNNYFGRMVAAADVTGDGKADVITGAFGWDANMGLAYVFHSRGSSGVTPDTTLTVASDEADSRIEGPAGNTGFGFVATAGDVNGDGLADLVVTAPWAGSQDSGGTYVFHSQGSSGVTADTTPVGAAAEAEAIFTGEADNDYLGYSAIVADVNGDGYGDVVVASYNHAGAGRVYVLHAAGSGGVNLITTTADASSKIDAEALGDMFGYAVSAADVNGDGYADVIAGAYGFGEGPTESTGRAYVLHSRGAGGVTADSTAVGVSAESDAAITGEDPGDNFGWAMSESGAAWD